MYLKQVELENFKSFGGKLIIPLMEGYMAITGPNGSGKSNITDAILFVLGPKSSKAVRAGRLTDLIFDGGKSQSKSRFTKVSLVFDNEDRLMPWDDDIVKLTRYVKLSENGTDYTSYFYINDRKSSLTEFDSLLTKARISADGYNMVQQGDVTRIVQMGNLERRRVLDGISGISSYDFDIDKAKGERIEAETNIDRINIVIEELFKQLGRLEKDREDAKKYIEMQNILETAKAQLVHRHLQIEKSKLETFIVQINKLIEEIESFSKRKEELKEEHFKNEIDVSNKEDEILLNVGPGYKKIKEQIENVKIKFATQKDRVERATSDKEEQKIFKLQFEESIQENETEYKSVKDVLGDLVIKLDNYEKQLQKVKDEDKSISEEISKHGGEHTTLQNKLTEINTNLDLNENAKHDAEVKFAKFETVVEECNRACVLFDERLQSASFDIKDAEWNLQQTKNEAGAFDVDSISTEILEFKKKEAELEKQELELKDIVAKLDREYNELMAEKKVSDRMNRGNVAVSSILELRDKGQLSGVHGTVQELATVESGYETALYVAAGSKMQAIVVDNDNVASEGIAYLKKQRLGRVTFLPLNKMIGGKPRANAILKVKETEGYATDLIDYDPKYQNIFWFVLQDTLVVKTLSQAQSLMGGVRLVTKEGEIVEASGAMVGGTINQQNIMKFGQQSESKLDDVGSKLRKTNLIIDTLKSQMRELRDTIRSLDDKMRKSTTEGFGAQSQIGQLTAQISELKKTKQSLSEEFKIKTEECKIVEKELSDAKGDLEIISATVESLRNERIVTRNRISEIAPAEIQEKITKVRDEVYRVTNEVSDLKSQKVGLETEIIGLEKQKESLDIQMSSIDRKIKEDEETISNHESQLETMKVELESLRLIERDMEAGIEDLRIEKDRLIEKKYRIESEKTSVQEKIETKSGVKLAQEAQIIIINQNIEQLNYEISQLSIEIIQHIPSEEELKRTIRSCENTMSKIGNVNLRAIEEYDEKKQRYDGLLKDVENLTNHINELMDLTNSLNSQKKGLFMQSYNSIDKNFREIYEQLAGGEAFMWLENEEDPFLGGLHINAKPKNGKMLRLEALSGGEKSLTALAFIFAIQEYQPSPFYVLDEVDMFLDSVNAEMVAKRVKESSFKAQFIQVSLRKVTLALADHLIGVTRPPDGISKVIIQPDFAEVSKYEQDALKKQEEAIQGKG